jgi:hypothetical protein
MTRSPYARVSLYGRLVRIDGVKVGEVAGGRWWRRPGEPYGGYYLRLQTGEVLYKRGEHGDFPYHRELIERVEADAEMILGKIAAGG